MRTLFSSHAAIALVLSFAVAVHAMQVMTQLPPCVINDPVDKKVLHSGIRSKVWSLFGVQRESVVYLKGNAATTEVSGVFRQEPNFIYMTGAIEEDSQFVFDLSTGESHLFVPYRDQYWAVWNGVVRSLDEIRADYGVTSVHYNEDLLKVMESMGTKKVYVLPGVSFSGMERFEVIAGDTLEQLLRSSRQVKTAEEIEVMRITATISGNSHNIVMQNVEPNWGEYQSESLFLHETYNCGCRHQSYTPIVGGSVRSAILHYSANSQKMADGDIVLIDAGAEYRGYTSDITRTYPVNGRFTEKQRKLYQMVLNTQKEAISALAPGVQWSAIAQQAIRRIVEELKAEGLISGDTDELITKKVYSLFYPHSLGHMLGLQVHDPEPKVPVGIMSEKERHEMGIEMISTLRPGMILTVEPGIYFIPALLEPAFTDPKYKGHLNERLIREYIPIGGVRIEDDLLITETGYEDFSAFIPKEVDEIEAFMTKILSSNNQ